MGLTTKQKRFIQCYDGNATRAAIEAGYSERWAASNIDKLLKNTEIQAAIQNREKERTDSMIADRQERQRFWTSVLRDPEEPMRDWLKASELLGRSEADFMEKVFDATPPLAPAIQVVFVKADTALEG